MSLDKSKQKNDVVGALAVLLSKLSKKIGTFQVNKLLQILCDKRLELSDVLSYLSATNNCEKVVRNSLEDRLTSATFMRAHVKDGIGI